MGRERSAMVRSLLPRLHRFLPAARILEIAPGFGRWTKFLLPICQEYLGVDISRECVEQCRSIFSGARHAQFAVNDGLSLEAAANDAFDFVFSFDALVHVEMDVIDAYVMQIVRKLTQTGVAFIHHSNLKALGGSIGTPHMRAESVSAKEVADQIATHGGKVLVQELINWGGDRLHDCLTLFCRDDSPLSSETNYVENAHFMEEANLIRNYQSHYSRVQIGK
jgi:SAM-dependent methyltransferase